MDYWAKAPESRGQMVLFATRLDEVLEAAHPVRMVDGILAKLDWTEWEAGYDLTRGAAADSSAGVGGGDFVWALDADSVESGAGRGAASAARFPLVGRGPLDRPHDAE